MRVVQLGTDEEAAKLEFKDGRPKKFRVMPANRPRDAKGRRLNTVDVEEHFDTIERAAEYLVKNPGSGIRMKPSGSVFYDSLAIILS